MSRGDPEPLQPSPERSLPAALAPEERRFAGWVCGWLFVLGGLTFELFPLLPGLAGYRLVLLLAVGGVAVAWGLIQCFVIRWDRVPPWIIHASLAFSLVEIAGAVAASGGAESTAWVYLFFTAVFVTAFFRRPVAYGFLVGCVATHLLPVLYDRQITDTEFFTEFAVAAPAYVVLGLVILTGKELLLTLRHRSDELAARQSALRRVATAAVGGGTPEAIYEIVSRELACLHGGGGAGVLRLEPNRTLTVLGSWSDGSGGRYEPGVTIVPPAGGDVERALTTGRPVRIDRHLEGGEVDALGYGSSVVAPLTVSGRTWGILAIAAPAGRFTAADEGKLAEFSELVAAAVASLEARDTLAAQASSDPLTGLANHRSLQERLAIEVSRAVRHELPLSLAVIDIDHFKVVNDTRGHEAGDAMLVALAGCLRGMARAEDILGRVGGDEFAWVMPETGRHQALLAVERVRRRLGGGAEPFTLSAGICDLASTSDPAELLRFADGALYWSKARGRDQCWIYDPDTIEELSVQERADHLERSQALLGLRALARAIDAKDPATREHSERVAGLVRRLALAAGWSADRARLLSEAALVHDVGKIGVPDGVLAKTGPLTPSEWTEIRAHAELSARIVDGVLTPEQVDWIRAHHERPDGAGYPDGLRAEEITPGAALLAVADAWDVMTAGRPYSPPKTVEQSLSEVTALVGAQFSGPAVVALRELVMRGELDGPQQPPRPSSLRL